MPQAAVLILTPKIDDISCLLARRQRFLLADASPNITEIGCISHIMPFLSTIKSIGSGIIRRERKHAPENQPKPQNTPGIVSATLPLPLKPVDLPGVNHEHQFALADQGWTKITYQAPIESDVLYNSAQALFQSSKLFFDLPTAQKDAFKTKEGSEEGWNYVEGEKEFITLRSIENTPLELKEAASEFCKMKPCQALMLPVPKQYAPLYFLSFTCGFR